MLFTSVVFTTFLVAVFSVALFCATGLSPVTAGLVAGFAVAEAAGFVAVVALPVAADFVAVALVLDFAVLVDFVALTGLAIVTGFVAVAGFATLTGFALGLTTVDVAVDLETVSLPLHFYFAASLHVLQKHRQCLHLKIKWPLSSIVIVSFSLLFPCL